MMKKIIFGFAKEAVPVKVTTCRHLLYNVNYFFHPTTITFSGFDLKFFSSPPLFYGF